jgi:hypothetical protein
MNLPIATHGPTGNGARYPQPHCSLTAPTQMLHPDTRATSEGPLSPDARAPATPACRHPVTQIAHVSVFLPPSIPPSNIRLHSRSRSLRLVPLCTVISTTKPRARIRAENPLSPDLIDSHTRAHIHPLTPPDAGPALTCQPRHCRFQLGRSRHLTSSRARTPLRRLASLQYTLEDTSFSHALYLTIPNPLKSNNCRKSSVPPNAVLTS